MLNAIITAKRIKLTELNIYRIFVEIKYICI